MFVNNYDSIEGIRQDVNILHQEVPRQTVAYLVGRDGSNVKQIEARTSTSISFIDPGLLV